MPQRINFKLCRKNSIRMMDIGIAKQFYRKARGIHPVLDAILFRAKHRGLIRRIRKELSGKAHVFDIHPTVVMSNVRFLIKGDNVSINIARESILNNVEFFVRGNGHIVRIGEGCRFKSGGSIWMEDSNCVIEIGRDTTFEDCHLAATEPGSRIQVGQNCMIAYDVDVRTGDSHAIYDLDGKRINRAKNIKIGDHVWVAAHCSILKGSVLPPSTIVGTRSIVTQPFTEPNSIIAGSPAKVLRRGVVWTRDR